MDLQNTNINWGAVEVGFDQATTEADIERIWYIADSLCHGRSDVDKLDALAEAARKRIESKT